MYFRNYILQRTLLDKGLQRLVSEGPSTRNMVNQPKHWATEPLPYLLITGKVTELKKLSRTGMENVKTVC